MRPFLLSLKPDRLHAALRPATAPPSCAQATDPDRQSPPSATPGAPPTTSRADRVHPQYTPPSQPPNGRLAINVLAGDATRAALASPAPGQAASTRDQTAVSERRAGIERLGDGSLSAARDWGLSPFDETSDQGVPGGGGGARRDMGEKRSPPRVDQSSYGPLGPRRRRETPPPGTPWRSRSR